MIHWRPELDPVSQAILKDKGLAFHYDRQYDNAIEMAQKTLEAGSELRCGASATLACVSGQGNVRRVDCRKPEVGKSDR